MPLLTEKRALSTALHNQIYWACQNLDVRGSIDMQSTAYYLKSIRGRCRLSINYGYGCVPFRKQLVRFLKMDGPCTLGRRSFAAPISEQRELIISGRMLCIAARGEPFNS